MVVQQNSPINWKKLEVHEALHDCLYNLLNEETEGNFEGTPVEDSITIMDSEVGNLYNEVNQASQTIMNEEINADENYHDRHVKSISALNDIKNYESEDPLDEGVFNQLASIDDRLSRVEIRINSVKVEAEKVGIVICNGEGEPNGDAANYGYYVCKSYRNDFICLCLMYDIKYDHLSQEAKDVLDGFFEEEVLPFRDYLRNKTQGLPVTIEEREYPPICPVFKEIQQRIEALCGYQDEFVKSEQESIRDQVKSFFEAYESLKEQLSLLGHGDLCNIPINHENDFNKTYFQSKNLYIQAAGADGSEGIAPGIHLRWCFKFSLGNLHLPKGKLTEEQAYSTDIYYNKPDDYVTIFRVPYTNPPKCTVDFLETNKSQTYNSKRVAWEISVNTGYQAAKIHLHFLDVAGFYNALQGTENFLEILENYNGIIELTWEDNLMYSVKLRFAKNDGENSAELELELLTSEEPYPHEDANIACREKINLNSENITEKVYYCENIKAIRFRSEKGHVPDVDLFSYYDFIMNKWDNWQNLGEFALTIDDEEAFARLEDTSNFIIDNEWPRFNDGTKVNVDAYKDKWQGTDGIKDGVIAYLEKSKTNPHAIDKLASEESSEKSEWEISYLKMLNLIAHDFHIARMLGLGYIDTLPPDTTDEEKFVYMAVYQIKGNMAGAMSSPDINQDNYFMTLPTSKQDHRKPLNPKKPEISFGIPGINTNKKLFDENGYFLYDKVRAINIKRQKFDFEEAGKKFFENQETFCTCERTVPVMYGVEYKNTNETNFLKPEITNPLSEAGDGVLKNDYFSHDIDFPEEGVRETIPLIDNLKSLFVHKERNSGEHDYGIYGINWFSRASEVSDLVSVLTEFPEIRKPLPPFNFKVQYVQRENTLIFTSETEQLKLANRKGDNNINDPYFTRVTFLWTHLHNDQYPQTPKVKLYIRESLLKEVKGMINEVKLHDDFNKVILFTGNFDSMDTGDLVIPYIDPEQKSLFEGSFLQAGGRYFKVVEIQKSGENPEIVIEGVPRDKLTSLNDPLNRTLDTAPVFPDSDEMFTLMEDAQIAEQWTTLEKEVDIKHFEVNGFDPYYKDETIDENGNKITLNAGGLFGKAFIENKSNEKFNGVYKISFNNTELDDHPDNDVDWYGGLVRVPVDDANEGKRSLDVLKIENQSPLTLWVYDPAALNQESPEIKTGNNIDVNFHPGYRVYLYNENQTELNHNSLYPESGVKRTKRIMCARSLDDSNETVYSGFSNPDVLLIREINTPEKPPEPDGPTFATRPDFYDKASFTFDTNVNTNNREPFAFIFYRATHMGMINKLYNSDTVESILENLENDAFINTRLYELSNAIINEETGKFNEYEGYSLPEPDIFEPGEYDDPNPEQVAEKKERIAEAVQKAFTPLTERPPLFGFIDEGYQTSNITPSVKDPASGRFLDPSDSEFNPFPFIRKFQDNGNTIVRFTDYTLDGASRDFVFYRVQEINEEMEMSEPGDVLGPITLLNANPPEKPQVKKVESVSESPVLSRAAGIRFEIEPYLKGDHVEKVRLYRTTIAEKLPHVRAMQFAGDYSVNQITDNFNDMDFPPFGVPVFYRLVALRKIKSNYLDNDDNPIEEFVPSKPSQPVVANVIDAVNPPAPEIEMHNYWLDNGTFQDVHLAWNKTVHNGKYHLYKMTAAGNWQKIHSLVDNNEKVTVNLQDTDLNNNTIEMFDEIGNNIYHHFKVVAENGSGLLSREEHLFTLGEDDAWVTPFILYKSRVITAGGSIINETITEKLFGFLEIDDNSSVFGAVAGTDLDSGNQLKHWFNLNAEGSDVEITGQGKPELSDIFNGIPRIAVEKEVTNLINDPDMCGDDNTDWVHINVNAEPAEKLPGLNVDAWKIINNGDSTDRVQQQLNTGQAGVYTFQAILERGDAPKCRLQIIEGGNPTGRLTFDFASGETENVTGMHSDALKLQDKGPNGGAVWMVSLTVETESSSPFVEIRPEHSVYYRHTFIHFTQMERGHYATLPVQLTRPAPVMLLPEFLPSNNGEGEGTVSMWVNFVNDDDILTRFFEANGSDLVILRINTSNQIQLKWFDSITHDEVLSGLLPGTNKRAERFICLSYNIEFELMLYYGDTEGNLYKTDIINFSPNSIGTRDIRPGQGESEEENTSVSFSFLFSDQQFRTDNDVQELYRETLEHIYGKTVQVNFVDNT